MLLNVTFVHLVTYGQKGFVRVVVTGASDLKRPKGKGKPAQCDNPNCRYTVQRLTCLMWQP